MFNSDDHGYDKNNLHSAKIVVNSDRDKRQRRKLIRPKTAVGNQKRMPEEHVELSVTQSLDLVRQEIKNYLQKEAHTPTAKILQVISSVYESNLSLRDYEIKKLIAIFEDSKDGTFRPEKFSESNRIKGKHCLISRHNFNFRYWKRRQRLQ
jgi:hypothetical protein